MSIHAMDDANIFLSKPEIRIRNEWRIGTGRTHSQLFESVTNDTNLGYD